jgi:hypothetical protein
MAVTLNASSTAGFVTTADTSTILQLQTNGTTAVTVDASQVVTFAKQPAGTFAGTGPAFSAYNNAGQTVTSSTYTKVNLQLEEFDTASCFDNATNYRFTPTVAGYYQVNGQISYSFSTVTRSIIVIYKNGSSFKFGTDGSMGQNFVSTLIYMNGSTDYIELYGWINGVGTLQFDTATGKNTYFQASMVRAA